MPLLVLMGHTPYKNNFGLVVDDLKQHPKHYTKAFLSNKGHIVIVVSAGGEKRDFKLCAKKGGMDFQLDFQHRLSGMEQFASLCSARVLWGFSLMRMAKPHLPTEWGVLAQARCQSDNDNELKESHKAKGLSYADQS